MLSPARLSCGIAALGLTATLGACNNDPGSGSVRVQYAFDAITSCDQNEETVLTIEVELGDEVATESATCDNAGGELVLSAPAGTYDIVVRGIDSDGDVVLDNLGGQITDDRVEIIGGDDKDFPVTMGLVPARLEVNLSVLNNGVFAQCTSDAITVKGLRAEAWSFAGQLHTHDFDLCDFDDFLPVPDEDRMINGRLFDQAVLQPIDASGGAVGPALVVEFTGPIGAGKAVRLSVQCENEDCSAMVLSGDVGTTTDDPTGDPTGGSDTAPGTTGDPTAGDDTTGGDTTGG
ncbi:MAG: hypothetical protein AB1Z98_39005 [Nannocystaceae bacterium]